MSTLAVAVEIDRVLVELRRQELGQPHRAAPGAAHLLARHAVLQHLQRGQELAAEHVLAPAGIGLRRQHADRVVRQLVAAVGGLAAPDRQDDRGRHAELPLDAHRASRDAPARASCPARRAARSSSRARSSPASARTRAAPAAAAPAGRAVRGRAATDQARARASPHRRSGARRRASAPRATAIAGSSGTLCRPARSLPEATARTPRRSASTSSCPVVERP